MEKNMDKTSIERTGEEEHKAVCKWPKYLESVPEWFKKEREVNNES